MTEPQSTNLIPYSESFDNSYWTKSGSSVVGGFSSPSADSPLGASKLVEDTSTGIHQLFKNIFVSGDYTFSMFVKKAERSFLIIDEGSTSGGITINLTTGAYSTIGTSDVSVTSFNNDWYRVSISNTVAGVFQIRCYLSLDGFTLSYTGDGTSGVYIFGAQLEELSYATSYMPTYGEISTRASETVSNAGDANTFNSTEGTLFIEAKGLVNGGGFRFVSLSSSSSNRIRLGFSSTASQISVLAQVDGGIIYNNGNIETSVSHNDVQKLALTYGSSGTKLYSNGVLAYSNVLDSSFVNTFTSAAFDDGNSANPFYGKTSQVQVFNAALSDAELITLTTI